MAYEEDLGPKRLGPELETGLYRVAQEALNNARKHAGPVAEIDVRVRRSGPTLVVEAVDADEAAHSEANRDAMAAAGLGEWRWDRKSGSVTLSHRAARILGMSHMPDV